MKLNKSIKSGFQWEDGKCLHATKVKPLLVYHFQRKSKGITLICLLVGTGATAGVNLRCPFSHGIKFPPSKPQRSQILIFF